VCRQLVGRRPVVGRQLVVRRRLVVGRQVVDKVLDVLDRLVSEVPHTIEHSWLQDKVVDEKQPLC